AGEGLDRPGQRGERIADLVGDVCREPADGGEAVGLAHPLLHALDGREILPYADEPDHLAFPGAQRPEGDADGHLEAVATPQADLVAQRLGAGTGRGQPGFVEIDPAAEQRVPCLAQRLSFGYAGDGLRGAIEGGDPARGVDRDESRTDRLEDQIAEGLKV